MASLIGMFKYCVLRFNIKAENCCKVYDVILFPKNMKFFEVGKLGADSC